MKEKRFRGYVDGHFVSGLITEKDDEDFQRDREDAEKGPSTGAKIVKGVVVGVVGALIIGALAALGEGDGPKKLT